MAGGSTGFFGLKTAQNVGIRVPTTHQSAIPGTVPRWYWPVSMQRPCSAFSLLLLRASAEHNWNRRVILCVSSAQRQWPSVWQTEGEERLGTSTDVALLFVLVPPLLLAADV